MSVYSELCVSIIGEVCYRIALEKFYVNLSYGEACLFPVIQLHRANDEAD